MAFKMNICKIAGFQSLQMPKQTLQKVITNNKRTFATSLGATGEDGM